MEGKDTGADIVSEWIRLTTNAIAGSDDNLLVKCREDLTLLICSQDNDVFPDTIFSYFVRILMDKAVMRAQGIWKLLLVFDFEFDSLTSSQRTELLQALECGFSLCCEWMCAMVIVEIIGGCYCNCDALECLCRLATTSADASRAAVVHGFQHIALDSDDAKLRSRAIEMTLAMSRDPSLVVRNEARQVLIRVGTC